MEASPEEIEASQEKEELLEPKSDYYLYPLLTSHEQHRYDSIPSGMKNNEHVQSKVVNCSYMYFLSRNIHAPFSASKKWDEGYSHRCSEGTALTKIKI